MGSLSLAALPPFFPLFPFLLSPPSLFPRPVRLYQTRNARYVPRPRRASNPARLIGVQLQPQGACLGVGTPQLARVVLGHLLDALPQSELPRLRLGEQLRRAPVRRFVLRHLAPHLVAQIGRLDDDGAGDGGAPYRCMHASATTPRAGPPSPPLSIRPSGTSSSALPPPTSSSFFSAWLIN